MAQVKHSWHLQVPFWKGLSKKRGSKWRGLLKLAIILMLSSNIVSEPHPQYNPEAMVIRRLLYSPYYIVLPQQNATYFISCLVCFWGIFHIPITTALMPFVILWQSKKKIIISQRPWKFCAAQQFTTFARPRHGTASHWAISQQVHLHIYYSDSK